MKLAAASPTDCYILHAESEDSPARLGRADLPAKTFTAIPLPAGPEPWPFSHNEICWTPQQGELLLVRYGDHDLFFRCYGHGDQKWNQQGLNIQHNDFGGVSAVIGIIAIALAIAVAIEAAKERKKEASGPTTYKVTVNDMHYEINSTLAGIQERMDRIFVHVLNQLEAWRKHVSEDLGALIVVGRLAKAQVWSAEALGEGVDPKDPAEIVVATQTSHKAYYEACVRTYAKALLRHFMMMWVTGYGISPDQMFTPRPTHTYPRFPSLHHAIVSPIAKSEAVKLHSAFLSWDSSRYGFLIQKGERRDNSDSAVWNDMGAPVGTDLVVFLYAHGATREGIANDWDLLINDGMCIDWGHD